MVRWQTICLQCKRPRVHPWGRKIPWRREWQPTPVFLPGEFHGQRSPAGYSLWGCKESDTTERLTQQRHHREGAGDGRKGPSKDGASVLIPGECRGFRKHGLFCSWTDVGSKLVGDPRMATPALNVEAPSSPFYERDKIPSPMVSPSTNIPRTRGSFLCPHLRTLWCGQLAFSSEQVSLLEH